MFLKVKNWVFPFFIVIIAIWSVWPVIKFSTNGLPSTGDSVLQVWIINQNIQKIPMELGRFFEGNIYYPYKKVIAYSDIFLPSTAIAYLPVKFTGLSVLAWNVPFIAGQILTMLVVYFWFKEMTKSKWAAILGAVVLGLSQIRMHSLHLQMWTMQWWLVSAWMIWRFTKNGKAWQLYVAGLFAAIQFWESPLPVYWIAMIGLVLLIPKSNLVKKNLKHFVFASVMAAILVFPAANAYYGVSNEFNYKRPIRDAAHFSLSLEETAGKFLSPGLFLLTALSFIAMDKKTRKKNKDLRWLVAVLIISFIMAMGPVVKVDGATLKIFDLPIPLPYAVAYYVIPGFGTLRTPSRWIWPAAFAASGIVALVFKKYDIKGKRFILVTAILLAILGGTNIKKIFEVTTPEQYPEVYSFISEQPKDVLLELPIYTWGTDRNGTEVQRMLYSLEHKKKLINGYSGFTPPAWLNLAEDLDRDFPSQELEERIKKIGVNYVIVHKDEYDENKLEEILNWGGNRLIREDTQTVVYEL